MFLFKKGLVKEMSFLTDLRFFAQGLLYQLLHFYGWLHILADELSYVPNPNKAIHTQIQRLPGACIKAGSEKHDC